MPAPERGPVHELLARADAVAARYDLAIAIGANHTCRDGAPCLACAEYEAELIEIEARERARERTR
jgi:predicted outer membrane protein